MFTGCGFGNRSDGVCSVLELHVPANNADDTSKTQKDQTVAKSERAPATLRARLTRHVQAGPTGKGIERSTVR